MTRVEPTIELSCGQKWKQDLLDEQASKDAIDKKLALHLIPLGLGEAKIFMKFSNRARVCSTTCTTDEEMNLVVATMDLLQVSSYEAAGLVEDAANYANTNHMFTSYNRNTALANTLEYVSGWLIVFLLVFGIYVSL